MRDSPYRKFSDDLLNYEDNEEVVRRILMNSLREYDYVELCEEFIKFIEENISTIIRYQDSSIIALSSIMTLDKCCENIKSELFSTINSAYKSKLLIMIDKEYRKIDVDTLMSYIRILFEKNDKNISIVVDALVKILVKINSDHEYSTCRQAREDISNSLDVLSMIYERIDLHIVHDKLDSEIKILFI